MTTLSETPRRATPENLDARVRRIVALHFCPREGSRYWLERLSELNFDPLETIRNAADLVRLGAFDEQALTRRPIADFLPRKIRENPARLVFCDTSGTTGTPKRAAFTAEEFREAFVDSFRPTARPLGFPTGLAWLFVGPSGPHPIGQGARAVACAMDSPEPFFVDFDPRWVRRLPETSFARRRYMQHLLEQTRWILDREEIGVLFSTPPVLLSLAGVLDTKKREFIRGVHFGGMELTPEARRDIAQAFPHAVLLSGYGNSLCGVSLETSPVEDHADYHPWGTRLLIRVVHADGLESVEYGETGRVVMTRLDTSMFIPNLVERDLACRIPPSARAEELGSPGDGVRDPHPPRHASTPRTGFY